MALPPITSSVIYNLDSVSVNVVLLVYSATSVNLDTGITTKMDVNVSSFSKFYVYLFQISILNSIIIIFRL